MLQGNLGISLRTDIPVLTLILGKLPVTLELAIFAMIIALAIGIPAGILSAVRKGTSVDYAANVVALVGPLHSQFLARDPAHHAGLRALAIAAGLRFRSAERGSLAQYQDHDHAGIRARHRPRRQPHAPHPQRDARRLESDYIRTARAKGLVSRVVIMKHALRNALIPIITLSTLLFGELLAGAVLTEQIFTIPGFGKLVVDAVFNRDYAVVQGVVLCTAVGLHRHEPAGGRTLRSRQSHV